MCLGPGGRDEVAEDMQMHSARRRSDGDKNVKYLLALDGVNGAEDARELRLAV